MRTQRSRPAVADGAKPPTKLRRSPFQSRSRQTVAAILGAAGQLLVEQGYGRSSTNAIAHRAGVSIGSLYQYFSSKEAVYSELVHMHCQRVDSVIEEAMCRMEEPRADLILAIEELMIELVRVHGKDPELMHAIDTELGWVSRYARPYMDIEEIVHRTAGLLRKRRDVEANDPDATAWLLVVTLSCVSRWLAHAAPPKLDARAVIASEARMVRGLLQRRT